MIRTPTDFFEARHALGLSVSQCASLCNVDDRTIRRWELGHGKRDGRDPHPSACRILELATGDDAARSLFRALTNPTLRELRT